MGALLARIPRKEFRMPCRPRKKQIRVLFIRIKQNLLFDLQGVMNVTPCRLWRWLRAILVMARNHNRVNEIISSFQKRGPSYLGDVNTVEMMRAVTQTRSKEGSSIIEDRSWLAANLCQTYQVAYKGVRGIFGILEKWSNIPGSKSCQQLQKKRPSQELESEPSLT